MKNEEGKISVIAEIKKASPSFGVIRKDFNPLEFALSFEQNGASAISVLTDEKYFQGTLDILKEVKQSVSIPVLRKDFIIDEYQIIEARAAAADAILLIAAILNTAELKKLYSLAQELKMDVLFELHNEEDILKALQVKPRIIGINNRNLKTFKTDLAHTKNLKSKIRFPHQCLVSESGIKTKEDIEYLRSIGVNAVLVGEMLMRHSNPGEALKELF